MRKKNRNEKLLFFYGYRKCSMEAGMLEPGMPPHPNYLGDQFFLQPTLLTIDEPQLLI